ncbi:GNAT family N-acetyltransferase [Nodularia sp. NIES-3585]|uniref:GNAT family N-acetyltransferase n=1 Tax=Nodularia sp. NIES-3585 TaxID=1973477 RepID=UPI000B5C54E8|nr:GNAT family N-acetyltransferase [Nodularia sp. NIES-3585]GAX35151.1 GCN5-like N-acetyltransferase [Nodularia sp. NIES-3585]
MAKLVITPENPTCSAIQELIRELDNYLAEIYPPESNHVLDISALLHKSVIIFLTRLDNEPVGCGALKFFPQSYVEVKRMYTKPAFRGKEIGKKFLNRCFSKAVIAGLGTRKNRGLTALSKSKIDN